MLSNASVANANVGARNRGVATQNRILERAVHIASVEGLSSMSLATLAKATAMSKSGLFAHFRSKEALQIAIIDEAERIFRQLVIEPARDQSGIQRLGTLVRCYLDYCANGPFDGGCFFAAAAHEFDGRKGPVRDRLVAFADTWCGELRSSARDAALRGELAPGVDPATVAFEVLGLGLGGNFYSQLLVGRPAAAQLAREAANRLIARYAGAPVAQRLGANSST